MAGSTQNLNEGGAQALQALLRSLDPEAVGEGDGKLKPETIEKLSKRLEEFVGSDSDSSQNRNEAGQLLNEEGLPIIEITEPVHAPDVHSEDRVLSKPDPSPVPLVALSPSESERRRRERDRILDLLEEEERIELAQEEELEEQQRQEAIRNRSQAVKEQLAMLKATKDMHKKMGKALLQGMSKSDPKTPPAPSQSKHDVEGQDARPAAQKSVKFADVLEAPEAGPSQPRAEAVDWGDVVPARLRPSNERSLTSKSQSDTLPMKVQVVERFPGKPTDDRPQPDSDDESEPPDSPIEEGSEDERAFGSDEELEEEVDLDFAQHQREVALEYHARRAKMAAATAQAMQHSHDEDGAPYITAEDSLNQTTRKPAISHFQANRLASSYNVASPSASKSLGGSLLPESSARTLQRAIRLGKLDSDNQLVGGEAGESGSDGEDEVAQEIMDLLRKGEVYNIGPDGEFLHAVPPPKDPGSASSTPPPAAPSAVPPPSSRKPPVSKFKLARPGQRPPAAEGVSESPIPSSTPTPPTEAARSSPKLAAVSSTVVERPVSSVPIELGSSAPVVSSMVVERSPVGSVVVESPSFPHSRRPQQPPAVVRASDKPARVSRFRAERT